MEISYSSATTVRHDNWSSIQIANNNIFQERTGHVETDCQFVRHHIVQATV